MNITGMLVAVIVSVTTGICLHDYLFLVESDQEVASALESCTSKKVSELNFYSKPGGAVNFLYLCRETLRIK